MGDHNQQAISGGGFLRWIAEKLGIPIWAQFLFYFMAVAFGFLCWVIFRVDSSVEDQFNSLSSNVAGISSHVDKIDIAVRQIAVLGNDDVQKIIPLILSQAKADASAGQADSTADSLSRVGRLIDLAAHAKIEIPKETVVDWEKQVNSIANQSKDELVMQAGAKTQANLNDYVKSSTRRSSLH